MSAFGTKRHLPLTHHFVRYWTKADKVDFGCRGLSAFDPKRTSGQSLNDLCLNSHLTPQYAILSRATLHARHFGFEIASYGRVGAKATGAIAPIAARCSRRRNANPRRSRPLR